ncbi:MAG TPA: ABC-2 family transporter protein [Leptospiraceae bacterium]|nr:ABC-2 family transporter protein [Leptospiraceae bacterium]HNF12465.1 ABC-2 family transporter protein [Leptospiraceae bacterium]HNF23998.1 ABC-2 family transporter protein [Leptospiraceae bacterium]HNH10527.1 ABC-2 family transporter protein [Leptospiraceae bacterium]HNI94502.1 ABC-2 family transporter protein [Leptospiraceae bacterium]
MNEMSKYLKLALASVKSRMEYRASFLIFLATLVAFYGAQVMTIGVIVYRFKSIGGWSMGEMAFLYCTLILSQGIVSCIFSGLVDFGTQVRDGSYDRVMIRPLSPILQVTMSGFELTGVTHIILGAAAFIAADQMMGIHWNFLNISYFLLVILGGTLLLASVRIIIAAVAFWAVNNNSLVHLFVFSSREFLLYPLNIYSSGVRFLLTFIVPLAFINFYPAHYFLQKNPTGFHPALVYATFPVGVVTFLISLLVWKMGQNAYESAGG